MTPRRGGALSACWPRSWSRSRSRCAAAAAAGAGNRDRARRRSTTWAAAPARRCHADEAQRWRGSHHDLAMQKPDERTVQGDFAGRSFEHQGVVDDASPTATGATSSAPTGRTAGWPSSRWPTCSASRRSSSTCWSCREAGCRRSASPGTAGRSGRAAQRFFHLYPDERIDHDDVLHWTKPSQNWNTQCAECHSTNLRKGYDLAARTASRPPSPSSTSSCEACHGPGSRHVAVGARGVRRAAASRSGTRAWWCASTSVASGPPRWTRRAGSRGPRASPRGASRSRPARAATRGAAC